MDGETILRLNAINRAFYQTVADDFDQTRGQAWLGWQPILASLKPSPLRILDVGCGNGRFGVFLSQAAGGHYHGVDNNAALLAYAQSALSQLPNITFELENRDIVETPPDTGSYDLVAAFGVLHHIPGYEQRLDFMRALAGRVAAGGILVIACWRFYEYARFRDRIVPFLPDLTVEKHDYLLDWRRGQTTPALRYCHYVDDEEHAALVDAAGLRELTSYRADGQDQQLNHYSILQRDL